MNESYSSVPNLESQEEIKKIVQKLIDREVTFSEIEGQITSHQETFLTEIERRGYSLEDFKSTNESDNKDDAASGESEPDTGVGLEYEQVFDDSEIQRYAQQFHVEGRDLKEILEELYSRFLPDVKTKLKLKFQQNSQSQLASYNVETVEQVKASIQSELARGEKLGSVNKNAYTDLDSRLFFDTLAQYYERSVVESVAIDDDRLLEALARKELWDKLRVAININTESVTPPDVDSRVKLTEEQFEGLQSIGFRLERSLDEFGEILLQRNRRGMTQFMYDGPVVAMIEGGKMLSKAMASQNLTQMEAAIDEVQLGLSVFGRNAIPSREESLRSLSDVDEYLELIRRDFLTLNNLLAAGGQDRAIAQIQDKVYFLDKNIRDAQDYVHRLSVALRGVLNSY